MDQEFWKKAWKEKNIGFHRDEFHPKLVEYFPKLGLKKGDRVLVPLCGKSRDLLWLKEQGYKVFGIELSEIAVEEFFAETNIGFSKEEYKGYQKYSSKDGDLVIFCGDFFQIDKSDLKNLDAIYDRAAIIALPLELRERYYQKVSSLLTTDKQILMVTLEYDQTKLSGPPFCVQFKEIYDRLGEQFDFATLDEEDTEATSRKFAEANISTCLRKVYHLKKF